MAKISRPCDYCQEPYLAESRYLRRGQGIYCSSACSAKDVGLKRRIVHEPNVQCAWCEVYFYLKPSSFRNSKSGLYFCCRRHKDQAQRIGGIREIQPDHYGSALRKYRILAFRIYAHKCAHCGYDQHPEILEVNHKDCNRKNNSLENLEILCPNCHAEFHFLTRTGYWRKRSGGAG